MEKRGLGRGLAALISDTLSAEEAQAQVRELPLVQIVANPYQPRTLFDPLKQEELVSSIREHGILQPILVRQIGHERYQLVAGERRFRASQAAGLAFIPALIKECNEQEQLEIAIVENLQREDIGAIEAARAYRRMADEFGMTQEMIARRVGKSRTAVTNTIGLLDLPEELLESVERNEISEGHARALKAIRDPGDILRAWRTVVKRGLSVRDTEKLARDMRPRSADEAANTRQKESDATSGTASAARAMTDRRYGGSDPNEADLLNQLQETLRTKVALRRTPNGAGRIEIEFYSAEDLERIIDALIS